MNQHLDNFYGARETSDGWQAVVYHYDETGNRPIYDFKSSIAYESKEAAEDAAVAWSEINNIDVQLE